METERPPNVGISGPSGPQVGTAEHQLGAQFGVNETAELVLDLLGRTALVPTDVLALVRGRTLAGASVTQALMDEGAATADGVAHMLSARHHLPLVDLGAVGVAVEAAHLIPVQTLERLVNALIFQAAEEGASDVHFEPQEDSLVVRFRVDGVLREAQRIPKRMAAGVTTRLKVLAKLDIAERRKPQDGRITLSTAGVGRTLDIRVATLPTVEGEKVVMRLLDKSRKPPTMVELGLSEAMRVQLEEIVRLPTGALLVTGPTGSGKSTTLYGCLAQINRPEINIITVEDPVEYRLAGVNQVQINVRAGLTFASSLRSILRSDPDVVMVGEIRDTETAKISI